VRRVGRSIERDGRDDISVYMAGTQHADSTADRETVVHQLHADEPIKSAAVLGRMRFRAGRGVHVYATRTLSMRPSNGNGALS
jgi:hypothetical protein